MCTTTRIDAQNNNGSITQCVSPLIHDATNGVYYCVWTEADASHSAFHNWLVKIRTINDVDFSFGTEHTVQTFTTGAGCDSMAAVLLTDGTLLVGFGDDGVRVRESTNQGLSWPTTADVDVTGAAYGTSSRQFAGLATDGTHVWCFSQESGGGGTSRNIYVTVRASAGVWGSPTLIFHGGNSGTNPIFALSVVNGATNVRSGSRTSYMKDALTGCIIADYVTTSNNTDQVRCLYTSDGWATVTSVLVADYTSSGNFGRAPSLAIGTDGRLRAIWVTNTGTVPTTKPVLAYSDDAGKTWTVVGTPAPMAYMAWDEAYDRSLNVDANNGLVVCNFDSTDGSNVKHNVFRGGDSLAGWTLAQCQNLGIQVAGATVGDVILKGPNLVRLFNKDSGVVNQVNLLFDTIDITTSGGAPPLTTEAPQGTDLPNTYLRWRVAERRGWSAHDVGVTCFSPWPEGDFTTERRRRLLLAAAAIIDPAVDSPANIPVLWKLDDPERWNREVVATDASGNVIVRGDAFTFEAVTKDYEMGGLFGTSLLRGFSLRYVRPTAPFTVEFWVDDTIAYTESVPASAEGTTLSDTPPLDAFFPCPTDDNAGSRCHLRITDTTEYPLVIVAMEPMWIEKRVRG